MTLDGARVYFVAHVLDALNKKVKKQSQSHEPMAMMG